MPDGRRGAGQKKTWMVKCWQVPYVPGTRKKCLKNQGVDVERAAQEILSKETPVPSTEPKPKPESGKMLWIRPHLEIVGTAFLSLKKPDQLPHQKSDETGSMAGCKLPREWRCTGHL